jgi:hypothetical protein
MMIFRKCNIAKTQSILWTLFLIEFAYAATVIKIKYVSFSKQFIEMKKKIFEGFNQILLKVS